MITSRKSKQPSMIKHDLIVYLLQIVDCIESIYMSKTTDQSSDLIEVFSNINETHENNQPTRCFIINIIILYVCGYVISCNISITFDSRFKMNCDKNGSKVTYKILSQT